MRTSEIGSSQIGTSAIGSDETGVAQIDSDEISTSEIGPVEDGSAEINQLKIGRLLPCIPFLNAALETCYLFWICHRGAFLLSLQYALLPYDSGRRTQITCKYSHVLIVRDEVCCKHSNGNEEKQRRWRFLVRLVVLCFSWYVLVERATKRGLRRMTPRQGRAKVNPYHRIMSYQDLASVAALVEAPEQQARMQDIANTLAQHVKDAGQAC